VDQAESVVVSFSVPTDFAEDSVQNAADSGVRRTVFKVSLGGGSNPKKLPQSCGVPDCEATLIVVEIHVSRG
jgi:hypothetical protein